ncbi:MAG: Coenzyme F420 hydrogenase/dehydrogenase, beta subunit C-terminal domain [Thermodesulfobacteriota bacterium]
MAKTSLCDAAEQNLQASLASFFKSVLALEDISALMAPLRLPGNDMIMQQLVTDPELLDPIDPFAPAFPMNAARLVSRLTKRPAGETVAVILRPCEIRALVELVKLKQGEMENIVVVGIDCPGAFKNTDYVKFAGENPETAANRFLAGALSGETKFDEDVEISAACRACTHPVPQGADLSIGIFGLDTDRQFLVSADTEKGEALFDRLGLAECEAPGIREEAIDSLMAARKAFQKDMFDDVREKTNTPDKLATYLSGCINCYNCRVACPVCYCRECVFVTDVFDHDPFQYLRWARRKGMIKMPTDTLFYHITRMAHISTACVGCGQCSNACPNDIRLAELFTATASLAQAAFDYEAGRSLEEEPPLAAFNEDEFDDVVEVKH